MKSIKEKAEEYGYTNWQSDEYHDGASEGLDFDPIGHTQKTFEAGANYVLGEVEKILSKVNEYKDGSDHTILYLDIEVLVKQLKK